MALWGNFPSAQRKGQKALIRPMEYTGKQCVQLMNLQFTYYPSSIYSWSIGHILEHEFFCLGRLGSSGSKEKKVDLSYSEQVLRVVFSTFLGQKKKIKSILAFALKNYIKWLF